MINSQVHMTTDKSLESSILYKKIKDSIELLFKSSGQQFFYGNCVSSCDILQNVLSQVGIKSKIIECQALAVKEVEGEKSFAFIGYDGNAVNGQIDTHTVLVIDEEVPLLVDISIGHLFLPKNRVVIERLNSTKVGTIAEYKIDDVTITYKEKYTIKLPAIHQKNLLQRIISDQNLEKTVKTLKAFIICAVSLGLINFILNITLIILRLYNIQWVE
jgi:hypothetical protein